MRVSTGSSEPEVEGVARISEDGSHVYFVAKGILTGEPRGGEGGICIKALTASELTEEETTKEGRCRPRKEGNNLYLFERDAQYPGGRILFVATLSSETKAELEAKETAACGTLPEPERKECEGQPEEYKERLEREYQSRNAADSEDWRARDRRPVQATPDGRFLVFVSAGDLTVGDKSAVEQVFEYDA